jgi:hypothetical protein
MHLTSVSRQAGLAGLAIGAVALSAAATPAVAQTATGPSAQERSWSPAAQRVGAFSTRAWANRGAGVTIAIVDSGIRANHTEFAGAISGGYNALTNQVGIQFVSDATGHGTHVASLAAARSDGRGMVGVASAARILPVQVFAGNSTTETTVARGISWATSQRAFVVNLSLGSPAIGTATRTALQNGVSAGQLFVIAAGNEGQANPSWPARHASEIWARGQIIAVGAVDAGNQIASFSNRAGDARNFFLVAPGVSLIGAYPTSPSAYAMMSGTSMAAPVVAGAAAVVKGTWPHLTAANVAQILFTTATDLGAPGTDAVFGRGLVNLERALQPVGNVSRTGSGSTSASLPLALAGTGTGKVTAGAFTTAAARGELSGVVFDSFNRDFGYDYGWTDARARSDGASVLSSALAGRMSASSGPQTGAGVRLGFSQNRDLSVAVTGKDQRGWSMAVGDAGLVFGAASSGSQMGDILGFASLAPVYEGQTVSVAAHLPLAEGVMLTAGVRSATGSNDALETDPLSRLDWSGHQPGTGAVSADAEVRWTAGALNLAAALSTVEERDSRLGMRPSTDLALSGAARTVATSFTASHQLTGRTALTARATVARTGAQSGAEGSLVRRASAITSTGWAVGLTTRDALVEGDAFALSVGSPLTGQSGHLDIALATGADPETGAPIVEDRRISLAAPAQELRSEASWVRPFGEDASFGLAVMHRANADSVAGREETSAALRFSTRF